MISFGLSEDQFCTRYRRELDRVSDPAIALIRTLIARPIDENVRFADIEVFLDDYAGAPGVWIYFGGENNKVDRLDQSIFPGRSMDLELPLMRLAIFDGRYFAEEFRGAFLVANLMKAWVSACWWKAGGWSYAVATKLHVHDDVGDGNVIQLTERVR